MIIYTIKNSSFKNCYILFLTFINDLANGDSKYFFLRFNFYFVIEAWSEENEHFHRVFREEKSLEKSRAHKSVGNKNFSNFSAALIKRFVQKLNAEEF